MHGKRWPARICGGLLLAGIAATLVGQTILRPRRDWAERNIVRCTPIEYPPLALEHRVQGRVVIEGILDDEGRVEEILRVDGPPALVEAAREAVREWEFRPPTVRGKPVRAYLFITIRFNVGPRGEPIVRPCEPEKPDEPDRA